MDDTNFMSDAKGKVTVLVVDDDEAVRRQLFWALDEEYRVLEASTREEAVEQLQHEKIDVVLSDLHLPPHLDDISEGLAIVEAARAEYPPVPVIVITGSASKRAALEAVNRGAYGFFQKPFDAEEVSHIVTQAARVRQLEQENLRLRTELKIKKGFAHLVGESRALENILKQARAVASTSATVLLSGENGTGKEMLALAIHEESPRVNGPFIAVSCAALPEALIESELFGYEKGAFTGALNSKKGRFELADGGTVFLDEIGELTQAVQVKLLRVLQKPVFVRLGGTRQIEVDFRLIAATNRDLEAEVKAGRFREDLYYRLNVVPLCLPPLRERREDIPVLAAHFAAKAAEKHGRALPTLDLKLIEALQEYEWPGNVRELENLMERLLVLTTGTQLGVEFLPEKMLHTVPETVAADETTLEGAILALKRRMIAAALQHEGNNKVAAARRLGISRSYLHRLISEFEMADSDLPTSTK
jgi:DNA-binding NtrC family response regulator